MTVEYSREWKKILPADGPLAYTPPTLCLSPAPPRGHDTNNTLRGSTTATVYPHIEENLITFQKCLKPSWSRGDSRMTPPVCNKCYMSSPKR